MDPRLKFITESQAIDIGFDSQILIFSLPDDLTETGIDVPLGSICVQESGIYRKIGANPTDWRDASQSVGIAGSLTVTANYTASGSVLIMVDTTANPVTIYLPVASTVLNKMFHIKWVSGLSKNKVTIQPLSGGTIDGLSNLVLAGIKDSRNVVSTQNGWVIV